MLHWICPDCGNDCSPTVRDCPVCAEAPVKVTEGVLALARSIEPAVEVRLLAPAPQQLLLAAVNGNGHSNGKSPAASLPEEDLTIPEDETIESLVRPLVESAGMTPVEEPAAHAESLVDTCVEAVAIAVEVAVKEAEAVQVEAVAAPVESRVESVAVAAPLEEAPAAETAPVPVPVGESLVESVAVATEEAPALETAQARAPVEAMASPAEELAPVAVEQIAAVAAVDEAPPQEVAPVVEAPAIASPLPEPTYDPGPLCSALELHAEAVLHVVQTQLEVSQSGIRAIVASFAAQPVTALLAAPREIINAPAQPATQWIRTARPSIPFVKPCVPDSSLLSTGPLTSALAGPCLPADLRTLIEHKSTKSMQKTKRGMIPAWFVSVLVATTLFLGAGSLLQYFSENRDAKAAPIASPQSPQASTGSSTAAAVDPHPFARFVEVTGLRVIADLNRKSQLQYLVVNHSAARLSDVALKIAVRSTSDSPGSPPLFTLSIVVPSLGPNQSKEMKSDLDAALRSTTIPDWDNLRADVQVSAKQ